MHSLKVLPIWLQNHASLDITLQAAYSELCSAQVFPAFQVLLGILVTGHQIYEPAVAEHGRLSYKVVVVKHCRENIICTVAT